MLDLAVIGAGPCGLAVGVAAKRARLTCSLLDKGPVTSSLMRYPLYMTFFSTPDKLEIGVPFVTAGDKPTRREALTYYRKVAEHFELDVRQYHTVKRGDSRAGRVRGRGAAPRQRRAGDHRKSSRGVRDRLFRVTESPSGSWGGSASRLTLLCRAPSLLAATGRRSGRRQQRGRSGPRAVPGRCPRDHGALSE